MYKPLCFQKEALGCILTIALHVFIKCVLEFFTCCISKTWIGTLCVRTSGSHSRSHTGFKVLPNVEGDSVEIKIMQLKPLSLGESCWLDSKQMLSSGNRKTENCQQVTVAQNFVLSSTFPLWNYCRSNMSWLAVEQTLFWTRNNLYNLN